MAEKSNGTAESPESQSTFVVAIGGSAGSLEVFEQLFSYMPVDAGMAFVVLSHFDPQHKAMMAEILQRFTEMPVYQAKDGQVVIANEVYVLPPDMDLTIENATLHTIPRTRPEKKIHLPIDFFLRSLAHDQGDRGIAIIVSGMGTDGTLGIQAVKEYFGMTIAQSVETARYDSMPQSAINSGYIDFIAEVDHIPVILQQYIQKYRSKAPDIHLHEEKGEEKAIRGILHLIRLSTNHDFSLYKKNTLLRRIERRLVIHQLSSFQEYLKYLKDHPTEISLLFHELLIGVTNFFRDRQVFAELRRLIDSEILSKKKKSGDDFRVWVPGCSTGEEAYSIAIVIDEAVHARKLSNSLNVQIFATDINLDAINIARMGVYPINIAADISKERLDQYFIHTGAKYAVVKRIRKMMVFAPQNLIMEPPFTKLDLLCCRNVLIYFDKELQKKIIPIFYYSLNVGGLLMLGTSESVDGFQESFAPLHQKSRLYKKLPTTNDRRATPISTFIDFPIISHGAASQIKNKDKKQSVLRDNFHKFLLDRFAPPALVVDKNGSILYISGKTGEFLEPSPGKAKLNLVNMARDGLKYDISNALFRLFKGETEILLKNLAVKKTQVYVDIYLYKYFLHDTEDPLCFVVFRPRNPENQDPTADPLSPSAIKVGSKEYRELSNELDFTKEHLQSTIEEMQSSQEELKSSYEELQAMNEELQSTNEELKTSKEELKSLNEELVTVNSELQDKIETLTIVNDDMKNVLNSIDTAIIILDNDLKIRSFTSQATKIMNLIPNDVGRLVTDLANRLEYKHLEADVQNVLSTLVSKQVDVKTKQNRWYSMRIIPYRTSTNLIQGVVVRFNDITEIKLALDSSYFQELITQDFSTFLTAINQPCIGLDAQNSLIFANPSFLAEFSLETAPPRGTHLQEIAGGLFDNSDFQRLSDTLHTMEKAKFEFLFMLDLPQKGEKLYKVTAVQQSSDFREKYPIWIVFNELRKSQGKTT